MVCSLFVAASLFGGTLPLFRATFDGYSTIPEIAAKTAGKPGGIPIDLQMRMDSGEQGMGNVLSLTSPEFVSYPMKGNFRPNCGTVSFWVKPCNYTLSDMKTFQMFFTANAPNYEFYVYKYTLRPNQVLFYLRCGDVTKFVVGDAKWKAGDWHKLDAAWDPNGMAIYVAEKGEKQHDKERNNEIQDRVPDCRRHVPCGVLVCRGRHLRKGVAKWFVGVAGSGARRSAASACFWR